jgi:hypothetical protein
MEGDVKIIWHGKALRSQGLKIACEMLDGCQDEANTASATEASGSLSAASFDASTLRHREPDPIDYHRSTHKADVVAERVRVPSVEAIEGLTVPTCTQHENTGYKPTPLRTDCTTWS